VILLGRNKRILILILGVLLLALPFGTKTSQIGKQTSNLNSSSPGNPPFITDLGGGVFDLDLYKENYTGSFPWEFSNEFWVLYWYSEYTADMDIDYFYYNLTYGSLNGYNGSFTPLYPTEGPGLSIDNEMYCFEMANPDRLANFGYEVKVWIEDSSGTVSDPFIKLFKYYNGTYIPPVEELEFYATTDKTIINPNDTIVIDFEINDPDGPRDYQINYTCDYENFDSISHADITIAAAVFTPGVSLYTFWEDRVFFNFAFNLTVWESSVIVESIIETVEIYVTSPPENGTCTTAQINRENDIYTYNVSCTGWEDELDGNGPFFYRCFSEYDLDNPDALSPLHQGTNESEFLLVVNLQHNGRVLLRVYDSHGAYTEVRLGHLGKPTNYPDIGSVIPGYPIILLILSVIPVIGLILWDIKKETKK